MTEKYQIPDQVAYFHPKREAGTEEWVDARGWADMSIHDTALDECLGPRALSVLRSGPFLTMGDVADHFYEGKGFRLHSNVGKKTEAEILEIAIISFPPKATRQDYEKKYWDAEHARRTAQRMIRLLDAYENAIRAQLAYKSMATGDERS